LQVLFFEGKKNSVAWQKNLLELHVFCDEIRDLYNEGFEICVGVEIGLAAKYRINKGKNEEKINFMDKN